MTIRMIDNEGKDQELFMFEASYREAEYMLQKLVKKLVSNISDDICISPRGLNDSYYVRKFNKEGEQVDEVFVYLY